MRSEIIKAKIWKFGDNIDTDVIIQGRYLRNFDLDELSSHTLETINPDFAKSVNKGDILVAGDNFGCGSSREQAPTIFKHLGVSVIIAKSFARIFYRNAINIALPLIVCDIEVDDGDLLEINFNDSTIKNSNTNKIFNFKKLDPFMNNILEDDGLINHYLKKKKN